MAKRSRFDAKYGGSQQAILSALGRPAIFSHWQAVLLDEGGDNGYWMRLIGQENCTWRRIGALVITPDAIGYSEPIATAGDPGKSGLKSAVFLARGGPDKLFVDFTWIAQRAEITAVEFEAAVDSPHSPYARLRVVTTSRTLSFGVDVGVPSVSHCVAAARSLAGAPRSVANSPSTREPRTDGIYICAANTKDYQLYALYFSDTDAAATLNIHDAKDALQSIRDGSWRPDFRTCARSEDGAAFTLGPPDNEMYFAILDERRLVYQRARLSGSAKAGMPEHCGEMTFISNDELAAGWGTVRSSATCLDWLPRRSASGWILAADLGAQTPTRRSTAARQRGAERVGCAVPRERDGRGHTRRGSPPDPHREHR